MIERSLTQQTIQHQVQSTWNAPTDEKLGIHEPKLINSTKLLETGSLRLAFRSNHMTTKGTISAADDWWLKQQAKQTENMWTFDRTDKATNALSGDNLITETAIYSFVG